MGDWVYDGRGIGFDGIGIMMGRVSVMVRVDLR